MSRISQQFKQSFSVTTSKSLVTSAQGDLIVENYQDKVPIDVHYLRKQARATLRHANCGHYDSTVWVVGNKKMSRLNERFRGQRYMI